VRKRNTKGNPDTFLIRENGCWTSRKGWREMRSEQAGGLNNKVKKKKKYTGQINDRST
jgi:hypothetical protein